MNSILADDAGTTSIEYALIAGAIFMVIVAVLTTLGPVLADKYGAVLPGLQP